MVLRVGFVDGGARTTSCCVAGIRSEWPDACIAVNFMDTDAAIAAWDAPSQADIIWTDAGVGPRALSGSCVSDKAIKIGAHRSSCEKISTQWFAGYFHKGHRGEVFPETDTILVEAAQELQHALCADGAVTTGAATSIPIDLDELRRLRGSLPPGFPLALASGVTANNVALFCPYVDFFFIGTGVEIIDPRTVAFYQEAYCCSIDEATQRSVCLGELDIERVRAVADAIAAACL